MILSIQEICNWAGTNPSQRNFVEGERILTAGHLIKCGKSRNIVDSANVEITAFCIQTSNLRDRPHEINGKISYNGKVISMVCSCKAGLGEKCKHITATLLYCNRTNINNMEVLSCTDKKCIWKLEHNKKLEDYTPRPLEQHLCFQNNHSEKTYIVSEDAASAFEQKVIERLPNSAFAKHRIGRHEPITAHSPEVISVTNNEKEAMKIIFANQNSPLMKHICQISCGPLKACCIKKLEDLNGNYQIICEETRINYRRWESERQCRVTGSTCYSLYTYTKGKNQDWARKCKRHLDSNNFTSKYTAHGISTEAEARDVFATTTGNIVIQTGIVISQQNPWLAVSPDGVVSENGKPKELLEIKCPFKGKSMTVQEAMKHEFKKCLLEENGEYRLKPKHKYYGQVQLGMAVLNVKTTSFVIYASYDKSLKILKVPFDEEFVLDMLQRLKHMYFNIMLHEICLKDGETKEKFAINLNV